MKHNFFLSLALFMSCMTAHAQLRVYPNGKVGVCTDTATVSARLTVGNLHYGTDYDISLLSASPASGIYNIGIEGTALPDTAVTGRNYGVRGIAGNSTSGYNYGVFGKLDGDAGGAGVYGTTGNALGTDVGGRYAGFFDGDLGVTGVAKARLVNKYDCDSTVAYDDFSLLDAIYLLMSIKGVTTTDSAGATHYGFATDILEQSYPRLIITDAQGRKFANYTEMIPIIASSLKEIYFFYLNRSQSRLLANEGRFDDEVDGIRRIARGEMAISQNSPNPFSGSTQVGYTLPEGTTEAYISVTDMHGWPVMRLPLDTSSANTSISSTGLTPGMYIYTLVADGRVLGTKRMIVNR